MSIIRLGYKELGLDMVAWDNPPKPQENKNTMKPKKDTIKWCEFHKISTHNTSECQAKKSLVAELKAFELDACFDSESEPTRGMTKGSRLLMQSPMPLLPLRRSRRRNWKI